MEIDGEMAARDAAAFSAAHRRLRTCIGELPEMTVSDLWQVKAALVSCIDCYGFGDLEALIASKAERVCELEELAEAGSETAVAVLPYERHLLAWLQATAQRLLDLPDAERRVELERLVITIGLRAVREPEPEDRPVVVVLSEPVVAYEASPPDGTRGSPVPVALAAARLHVD